MDLHLRGKSVLITGASKGIGAAAAEVFAEEGCDLHLAARGQVALESLAERLTADHGVGVRTHAVDLRQGAYLASDRSAYTSGVVFTVDGGISARGG